MSSITDFMATKGNDLLDILTNYGKSREDEYSFAERQFAAMEFNGRATILLAEKIEEVTEALWEIAATANAEHHGYIRD